MTFSWISGFLQMETSKIMVFCISKPQPIKVSLSVSLFKKKKKKSFDPVEVD
jgi:hypothetical protein